MTEDNTLDRGAQIRTTITAFATAIIAAYVSNNAVAKSELPDLIASVRASLADDIAEAAAQPAGAAEPAPEPLNPIKKPTPAEIRKSVTPDALVSFIDGRSYKLLKRHLTSHGLTPDTYRTTYGLPADYPVVAPSYAQQRSELAKQSGLGRHGAPAA